ncbi:hypothetical protein MSAN_02264800 [Mycena sanguinolenta]|uniref:DUF6534 domain-containing protein n=1 Tax=Mycena sanguinolenta TaxID=230812 RepID=A0A8H6XB49_9AGAR|nr:hypothetical protein MSAN_02264800 [Mycena sanguinolenta]
MTTAFGTSEATVLIVVIASWLNIGLYCFELVLCARYFARPARPLVHKIGVGILVFFDTVCTLAVCSDVGIIVAPPTTTNIRLLLIPLATQIITTYISSIISQLFLCNLYFILTGYKIVAGIIVILIFVHLAFSWASAIILLKTFGGLTTTTVGAISCAATDLIIAVCLAWKFWQMMAGTRQHRSTRSLLRRILILTVSSGAICAGNTLLMMILLLKDSEGAGRSACVDIRPQRVYLFILPVFNFFFSCQGRVYALTLLGNFLVGIPARVQQETSPSLSLGTSILHTTTVIFRDRTEEDADDEGASSPVNASTSKSVHVDGLQSTASRHESVQLEDLALGRMNTKINHAE